jgi:hypothetical protein
MPANRTARIASAPDTELTGPIIAERTLCAQISQTETQEILIRMAAPERQDDGCYFCRWELVAPGYCKSLYAGGIDGFQAIHLATRIISVYLFCIARDNGWRITFEGSDDLGFPP